MTTTTTNTRAQKENKKNTPDDGESDARGHRIMPHGLFFELTRRETAVRGCMVEQEDAEDGECGFQLMMMTQRLDECELKQRRVQKGE